MICPNCKKEMQRLCYPTYPPQYGYECFSCGKKVYEGGSSITIVSRKNVNEEHSPTYEKLFIPCPNCGENPSPITKDGRCGHCGEWQFIKLENASPVMYGRYCIVCGEGFEINGIGDNRTICPDCCRTILELKQNRKRNWVAGSKGGVLNCRKV